MNRTDFLKNTEETSLLDFIHEREAAMDSIVRRSKRMRKACIIAIAVWTFATAYLGVLVHLI